MLGVRGVLRKRERRLASRLYTSVKVRSREEGVQPRSQQDRGLLRAPSRSDPPLYRTHLRDRPPLSQQLDPETASCSFTSQTLSHPRQQHRPTPPHLAPPSPSPTLLSSVFRLISSSPLQLFALAVPHHCIPTWQSIDTMPYRAPRAEHPIRGNCRPRQTLHFHRPFRFET